MSTRQQAIDFSVDLMQVLLWQYNDAERLQSIVQQKQEWYNVNQQSFWDDWVRDVFDLRTANEFGLSVWSIILDQPLSAQVGASDLDAPSFGFGPNWENYNNGNYMRPGAGSIGLTLEQQRLALRLRYFKLVSRGTIPEINRFLKMLFESEGTAYVRESGSMDYAVFVLNFEPSSGTAFILREMDLLPRPAGVGAQVIVARPASWGVGPFRKNFFNSNFPKEG